MVSNSAWPRAMKCAPRVVWPAMEPWEMGVEDSEDEELFSSDEEFADEELCECWSL